MTFQGQCPPLGRLQQRTQLDTLLALLVTTSGVHEIGASHIATIVRLNWTAKCKWKRMLGPDAGGERYQALV